jgi:hypothetical protein
MTYIKSIFTLFFISIILSNSQAQNVGINILNPEYALDIKSINDRVFKLISRQDLLLMEVNDKGNFGFNTAPTGGSASLLIKPGNLTTNAEEVLAIRDANNLSILAVEEQRRVGILTESPLTKLHVQGGVGNTNTLYGDFAIGDLSNSIRMGIYTSGTSLGRASLAVNGTGLRQLTVRAGSGASLINFDGLNHKIGIGFTSVPETYFHIKRPVNYDVKFESSTGDVDLIIDGKSGTNGIEFQNDGTFQGSFGYDATQDRLFMYSGGNVMYAKDGKFYLPHLADVDKPVLKVTADGEIITDEDDLNTWTFGAISFLKTHYNGSTSDLQTRLYGIGAGVSGGLGSFIGVFAPVQLPQGCTIRKMKIAYRDVDSVGNLKIEFYKTPILDSTSDLIVSVTSSGNLSSVRTSEVSLNEKIDNTQNAYFIKVSPTSGNWQNAGYKHLHAVQLSEDPNF